MICFHWKLWKRQDILDSYLLVYMGFFIVRGLIKASKHCLRFDRFHWKLWKRQDILYQLSPCAYGFLYGQCSRPFKTSKHCLRFDSFLLKFYWKDKTSCISFLLVYKGFFTVNVRGLIKTSKHCLRFDRFYWKLWKRQDILYQLSPCI